MRRTEIATALVMAAIAGLVLVESRGLPFWSDFAPGSAFMPILVAAAGAALAALLGWQAWQRGAPTARDVTGDMTGETSGEPGERRGAGALARVAATAAGLFAVVALTPWLGLILPMAAFVAFVLLVVVRRPLLPSLVTTALTMGLIWGVFVAWLGVAVPRGPFGI